MPPKGVLLLLSGGPGQGGIDSLPRLTERLGPDVAAAYRLVMLDQRGTGAGALQCPDLQQAMGFSDLDPPPAEAVTSCARGIGPDRRFYSTADTVADLDDLRAAVGVGTMSISGVSYGTFVAEQYALAHPERTARLVLDSVVPDRGIDPLAIDIFAAVRRVLPAACAESSCGRDPVADLRTVVRERGGGVALLDAITTTSIIDPSFGRFLPALAAAAQGNPSSLDALVRSLDEGSAASAEQLSQGLHASTLCTDWRFPWGSSAAPLRGREVAVRRGVAALPKARLDPFDAATASGNGFVRQCLPWPPTAPARLSRARDLPAVPVLLLGGGRDLSTPLAWAQAEAARAPRGHLVVVPGAGHGVYRTAAGVRAVREFLLG